MAVESVKLSLAALPTKRRMAPSATPGAVRASMESALFAGNTAQMDSEMMALFVPNLDLMAEVSDILYGMRISATAKTKSSAAKSGA